MYIYILNIQYILLPRTGHRSLAISAMITFVLQTKYSGIFNYISMIQIFESKISRIFDLLNKNTFIFNLYFCINILLKHKLIYKLGSNVMYAVFQCFMYVPINTICIQFYYELNIIIFKPLI